MSKPIPRWEWIVTLVCCGIIAAANEWGYINDVWRVGLQLAIGVGLFIVWFGGAMEGGE